jgi:hypothetical protein
MDTVRPLSTFPESSQFFYRYCQRVVSHEDCKLKYSQNTSYPLEVLVPIPIGDLVQHPEANMTDSGLWSIESTDHTLLFCGNCRCPFSSLIRATENETDDSRFNRVRGEGLYLLS